MKGKGDRAESRWAKVQFEVHVQLWVKTRLKTACGAKKELREQENGREQRGTRSKFSTIMARFQISDRSQTST